MTDTTPADEKPSVMLDLETLGREAGCVILSIGAHVFSPTDTLPLITGDDFRPVSFYATIPVFDSLMHGMTIDPETLAWWQTQDDAASQIVNKQTDKSLALALSGLCMWFKSTGAERVYCQGAAFDIPIIEAAFKRVGLKAPWDFWNVRDTRTVYDTLGFDPKSIERQGTYHNALDDARHQIKCVQAAFKGRG